MSSKQIHTELAKLTKLLLKNATLDNIYEQIAKNICRLLKASASMIVLYDESEKKFSIAHVYNLSEQYLSDTKADIAAARMACKSKATKFVKNAREFYRRHYRANHNLSHKLSIVSLVSTPLLHDGKVFGGINIYYRRHTKFLKARESLDLFAKMATSVIAHANLYSQLGEKNKIMKGLENIGMLLSSSFETSEIIKTALSAAANIANADSSGLILVDEKNKRISNAYEYNEQTRKTKAYKSTARLDEGISGAILKSKRAVAVADLSAYPNVNPVAIKKKRVSVVGIPLIARERTIGILFLDSLTPRTFKRAEIDHLTILANQTAIALDNALLDNIVKREAKETALLYEVSQSLISTLDFDQLLKNILQHLKETFDFLNVSVLLVDEEKQILYTHSSITYSAEDNNLKLRIGKDGITGHVAKTKRMYYSPDVRNDTYYVLGNDKTRSEVCFPLLSGDHLIGVLDVESSVINGFSQDVIRLLSSLSAQIAIAIDNARLYAETKKLSLTDSLTQLSNRRSFDIFIEAEIRRAERYRRTFVAMMIDFDNFKNYNDRYGHTAGDIVLQKLSKIMKDIIRDVDFLCRYGGDEFVAILPETDASFALDVAERMRKKIAAQKIQPKITLSIGIASFPHDARDKSKLIDLADQACYEAKQRGGNRVLFTFKPKEDR
jgi:diguanylate cyclase (GGDEF)-like protein